MATHEKGSRTIGPDKKSTYGDTWKKIWTETTSKVGGHKKVAKNFEVYLNNDDMIECVLFPTNTVDDILDVIETTNHISLDHSKYNIRTEHWQILPKDKPIGVLKGNQVFLHPPFDEKPSIFGMPLKKVMVGSKIPDVLNKCFAFFENEKHLQEEGIFRLSGNKHSIEEFKNMFDDGVDVNFSEKTDPHVVAGILKLWIRQLPEPLATFPLYDKFLSLMRSKSDDDPRPKEEQIRDLVEMLPDENFFVLRSIISFFKNLSKYEAKNKMGPQNISIVLTPNIFKPEVETIDSMTQHTVYLSQVTIYFITHFDVIFQGASRRAISADIVSDLIDDEIQALVETAVEEEEARTGVHRANDAGLADMITGNIASSLTFGQDNNDASTSITTPSGSYNSRTHASWSNRRYSVTKDVANNRMSKRLSRGSRREASLISALDADLHESFALMMHEKRELENIMREKIASEARMKQENDELRSTITTLLEKTRLLRSDLAYLFNDGSHPLDHHGEDSEAVQLQREIDFIDAHLRGQARKPDSLIEQIKKKDAVIKQLTEEKNSLIARHEEEMREANEKHLVEVIELEKRIEALSHLEEFGRASIRQSAAFATPTLQKQIERELKQQQQQQKPQAQKPANTAQGSAVAQPTHHEEVMGLSYLLEQERQLFREHINRISENHRKEMKELESKITSQERANAQKAVQAEMKAQALKFAREKEELRKELNDKINQLATENEELRKLRDAKKFKALLEGWEAHIGVGSSSPSSSKFEEKYNALKESTDRQIAELETQKAEYKRKYLYNALLSFKMSNADVSFSVGEMMDLALENEAEIDRVGLTAWIKAHLLPQDPLDPPPSPASSTSSSSGGGDRASIASTSSITSCKNSEETASFARRFFRK